MSYFVEINANEAQQLVETAKPLILDVRDYISYKEQHIEGAMHSHGDLVEHLIKSAQFDRPVLIYCYHGNSSKDLAEVLGRAGFHQCYSLKGGFTGWKKRETTFSTQPYSEATNVWLEDHGFEKQALNGVNHFMETPLIVAAREANKNVMTQLLAAGADLEYNNSDGNTALWAACYSDDISVLKCLIEAGANLNHQNPDGVTVLMYAASTGKTDMVDELLQAGAATHLTTKDDFTALDLAANAPTLRLLKSLATA